MSVLCYNKISQIKAAALTALLLILSAAALKAEETADISSNVSLSGKEAAIEELSQSELNNEIARTYHVTPERIYTWAKDKNTAAISHIRNIIDLTDENGNTALCLAQMDKDQESYRLLLEYGASKDVGCHDDDDPICAIIVGSKLKPHPAGLLLGAAAAAGAAYYGYDEFIKNEKCPSGWSVGYPDVSACGKTGALGWLWDANGSADGKTCGRCQEKTYDTGCSVKYQNVADCGAHAEDGWIYETSGYQGDLFCGICTPKQCPVTDSPATRGSSTMYFTTGHCPKREYMKAENTTHAAWSGEKECFTCNYVCDETTGFALETSCQNNAAGQTGYLCAQDSSSLCWYRAGSIQCPVADSVTARGSSTMYFTSGHCPAREYMKVTTATQEGYSGEKGCYTCNYACDETMGFALEATCEKNKAGFAGYICQKDADTSCWHHAGTGGGDDDTSKRACDQGYETTYQTAAECAAILGGRINPDSWNYEQNGYSGEEKCGKCTALPCTQGSTEYTSFDKCPAVPNANTKGIIQVGYSGNVGCFECLYTCVNSAGAYDTYDECKAANATYQCDEISHGCYYKGTPAPCTTGSTAYTNVAACGASGATGWTWEQGTEKSGELYCNICTKKTCTGSYTTEHQTVADCGSTGAQGWTITQSGMSGDDKCTICNKNSCTGTQPSTDANAACQSTFYATATRVPNTGNFNGNDQCYVCSYQCGASYFSSQSSCLADNRGYACSQDSVSKCWYKTTTQLTCPSGSSTAYSNKASCPEDSGATITGSHANGSYSGPNACYVCDYSCASDAYPSLSSCRDNYAWTCTKSDYANCYFRQSAASCYEGSTNSSASSCALKVGANVTGTTANGYYSGTSPCYTCNYECIFKSSSDCAGTNNGYSCTYNSSSGCYVRISAKTCPSGTSTAPTCITDACVTSSIVETSDYAGDTSCKKCSYTCNLGDSCVSSSVTGDGYNYTQVTTGCYRKEIKACTTGSTDFTKAEDCVTMGGNADSWVILCSGYSGETPCCACTNAVCPTGSNTNCTGDESGSYAGNKPCYLCTETAAVSSVNEPEVTSFQTPVNLELTDQNSIKQTEYLIETTASNQHFAGQSAAEGDTVNLSAEGKETKVVGSVVNKIKLGETGTDNVVYAAKSQNSAYNAKVSSAAETNAVIAIEDNGSGNVIYGLHAKENAVNTSAQNLNEDSIVYSEISLKTATDKEAYGLYAGNNAENTAVDDKTLGTVTSKISLEGSGAGSLYGIYSEAGRATNIASPRITGIVTVNQTGTGDAYGLYAKDGDIINNGTVNVSTNQGTAYGLYLENGAGNTVENSGEISVTSQNGTAYGIYVKDGGTENNGVTVINSGTINATGNDDSRGIKIAENGINATISNTGKIIVNGSNDNQSLKIDLGGATLSNSGEITFISAQNLNALNGQNVLEKGGTYISKEGLSGDLGVGVSVVQEGFKDTYVAENAVQSENVEDLKLSSQSAMFNTSLKQNQNGAYDVISERRGFENFTPNASIAAYLEENYRQNRLEELYGSLKTAATDETLSEDILNKTGADFLINLPQENINALRHAGETIVDSVIKDTDEQIRIVSGADYYFQDADGRKGATGYETSAATAYMFGDKRLNNKNRLGLGLAFMQLNSSYDNGADRKENFISVFLPWVHKFTDRLRLASVLSLGYGYGDYDRSNKREADINDYIYALNNKLVYSLNLADYAELEPALILNAVGYYQDDMDEGDLVVKGGNHLSVEAGLGLFVKKDFKSDKYGKLTTRLGGIYYHELADPYNKIRAGFKGGVGSYAINDFADIYSRDRAVLSAMLDYEYKKIALYAKYYRLLQKNKAQNFDLGLKYNF